MKDLTKFTPTELLKMINDTNQSHEALKAEIIGHTIEVDALEKTINEKLNRLKELEKNYIELIDEMNNR